MSSSSEPSPAARAINFLHLTQSLKTTPRTGWVNHGVDKPESIADHMYRMSLMAMVAAKEMPHLAGLALLTNIYFAVKTPHNQTPSPRRQYVDSSFFHFY
jgi:hypothetical protein